MALNINKDMKTIDTRIIEPSLGDYHTLPFSIFQAAMLQLLGWHRKLNNFKSCLRY